MRQNIKREKVSTTEVYTRFNNHHQRHQSIKNYLYAFDLYIDSARVNIDGYFYLVWKKGSKSAQSLKYDSKCHTTTVVKQTLSLNFTFQIRNQHPVEKHTTLLVLDAQGRITDQLSVTVHQWSQQFGNISIPLKNNGNIQAKVRAKRLMEIDDKYFLSGSDYEDAYDDWKMQTNVEKIKSKYIMKPNYEFVDDEKDEIIKLRKELEDTLYYNNKLKNDRNVLITRNVALEGELQALKKSVKQHIQSLQSYYKSKLEIRETIYEDQINKLVNYFNSNSEQNTLILQSLIIQYQNQLKSSKQTKLIQQHQNKEMDEIRMKLLEIEKQKSYFQNNIVEVQQKQQELFIENAKLKKINEENRAELDKDSMIKDDLNKRILELSLDIETLKGEKQKLEEQLCFNSNLLQKIQVENRNHLDMVEKLSSELQLNKYQLQFTENAYKKQREQNEHKEQCYRAHIRDLQRIIEELEDQSNSYKKQAQEQAALLQKQQEKLQAQKQKQRQKQTNFLDKQTQTQKETPLPQQQHQHEHNQLQNQTKTQMKVIPKEDIKKQLEHQMEKSRLQSIIHDKSDHTHANRDDLLKEIEQLKSQLQKLYEENQKLRKLLQELQSSKIDPKQYQELLKKQSQMEEKMKDIELHSQEQRPKEQGEDQHQKLDELLKKINQLQDQNKNLAKQKEDYKTKLDLLTVQMAKKYAEAQRQKELLEERIRTIKVFEYCDSEDEENKKLIEKAKQEYEKVIKQKMDGFIEGKDRDSVKAEENKEKSESLDGLQIAGIQSVTNSRKEKKQRKGIKKSKTMDKPLEEYEQVDIMDQNIINEESAESRVIEYEEQGAPRINFRGVQFADQWQNKPQSQKMVENRAEDRKEQKIEQKAPKIIFGEKIFDVTQLDEKVPIKEQIIREKKEVQIVGNKPVKEKIIKQKKEIIREQEVEQQNGTDGTNKKITSSDRSKSLSKSDKSKSRESYISKDTIYMFQKVSHRQKIDRLTTDVEHYKVLSQQLAQQLSNQRQQMNKKIANFADQQKMLKESMIIEQEKNKKSNVECLNKHTQIELERESKHVQAMIPDPELIQAHRQLQQKRKQAEQLSSQLMKQIQESEKQKKLLIAKITDYEYKNDIIIKKYQQLDKEYIKHKKENDQKQRLYKDQYQDLKLQNTQLQYQNNNLINQNKKFITRIQELQEKLKKNDVMDLLRQTQFEAENSSKKIIELNRNIYQNKLERQTLEDEIRLLRKKNADVQKKLSESEDSIDRQQKTLDDFRRKQVRNKREIEDRQDMIEKLKDQIKRMNQQVGSTKNFYMQQDFERKKLYDQLQLLQNTSDQKDFEISSLKKQIERTRKKLQDKQQQKMEKKSELRREIDRLGQAIMSKQKQIMELESTVKQLTNKLGNQADQSKKVLQEKTFMFSEKLKVYVNEINDLKKAHAQNLYEIDQLRGRLNESLDQLEMKNSALFKMEQKYKQIAISEEQLRAALAQQKRQNQTIKQSSNNITIELDSIKNSVRLMKGDLDREKKEGVARQQQLEKLRSENQGYIEAINKYKIKLSEFETSNQINKNFNEKLGEAEKYAQSLEKDFREVKLNYEEYRAKYQHTPQQLDSLLRKSEKKAKENLEISLQNMKEECESTLATDKKKFEAEIIDLFNEISKIKSQSQKKSEIISQLQLKLSKLEVMPLKFSELENLYKAKEKQLEQLRPLTKDYQNVLDKITRLEDMCSQTNKEKQDVSLALAEAKSKLKQQQQYLDQFQSYIRTTQNQNKDLNNRIEELGQNQKSLKGEISGLQQQKSQYDHQIAQLNKVLENNKSDYRKKMKLLEEEMELMGNSLNQHNKALENDFEQNIMEFKYEIEELRVQLANKNHQISDLESTIDNLNILNQQTKRQGEKIRFKLAENEEFFELEIEKFKNRLSEAQKMYKATIKDLEAEIEDTNRQLMATRAKNFQQHQLRKSKSQENIVSVQLVSIQRLEQKIRGKNDKIQQLQKNSFMLEQTIIKLKKSLNSLSEQSDKIVRLEQQNSDLSKKIRELQFDLQNKNGESKSLVNSLRNQLLEAKRINEQQNLQLQQYALNEESLKFELATIKELYRELQEQIDKRKGQKYITNQQYMNMNQQLKETNDKLNEYQLHSFQYKENLQQKELEIDKKCHIIETLESRTAQLERSEAKLKNSLQTKMNQEGQHYKQQINRLNSQNQVLTKQNKNLKDQIQRVEKQNWDFSTQLSLSQNSIDNLSTNLQEMVNKCRQMEFDIKHYQILEEKCMRSFQISLEEAFVHNYLLDRIQQKQFQLNTLAEEVDELKFLHERKLMDYDELKKENYELKIKAEDAEFATEQVQELREICDKLEQEKKQSVFKLQLFMMQFESLMNSSSAEVRSKLEDIIKRNRYNF